MRRNLYNYGDYVVQMCGYTSDTPYEDEALFQGKGIKLFSERLE